MAASYSFLLVRKNLAYPTAVRVLGAFIFYQIYRFTHTHSLGLLLLTLFDVVAVLLVWREYWSLKHHVALK